MDEDEMRVAPLVAKVEAGDALTDDELAQLRQASDAHPESVDWLLCLGHAYVNSDVGEPALQAFDRALAMKPDEVLVLIGHARALAALERYDEAAADLRKALRIHPRHADALRALAILRLRVGAFEEAASLAGKVLEVDPLDEWAKQIQVEAKEAATATAAGPIVIPRAERATKEQFATALQSALSTRAMKSRVDAAFSVLVVDLPNGRQGRMSLANLYDAYAAGDRTLTDAVEAMVEGLVQMKDPRRVPDYASVRERIYPVLRPRDFLSQTGPALSTAASSALLLLFVVDHPDYVSYLPPEAIDRWDLPLETVAAQAWENLEREPVPPTRYLLTEGGFEEAHGDRWDVLAFDSGDGYDASRLLSRVHREALAALDPGPWVVAMPTRSYALVARLLDQHATRFLRQLAIDEAQSAQKVSAALYQLDAAGNIAPFDAPPQGPLN